MAADSLQQTLERALASLASSERAVDAVVTADSGGGLIAGMEQLFGDLSTEGEDGRRSLDEESFLRIFRRLESAIRIFRQRRNEPQHGLEAEVVTTSRLEQLAVGKATGSSPEANASRYPSESSTFRDEQVEA